MIASHDYYKTCLTFSFFGRILEGNRTETKPRAMKAPGNPRNQRSSSILYDNQPKEQYTMRRCPWCEKTDIEREYHDSEWGVPVFSDSKQFEFLILESAQAGLSWLTVLRKRENYRRLYDGFDPEKVSRYGERKIRELMSDSGIIRNRRKIEASINNAVRFLEIQGEFGSFSDYLWGFTDGVPVTNSWEEMSEMPASTELSVTVSSELKKRGFRFMGPTIVYAHLQATGMVNDHLVSCFRYEEILGLGKGIK